jgi:hypothetical protein
MAGLVPAGAAYSAAASVSAISAKTQRETLMELAHSLTSEGNQARLWPAKLPSPGIWEKIARPGSMDGYKNYRTISNICAELLKTEEKRYPPRSCLFTDNPKQLKDVVLLHTMRLAADCEKR